MILLYALALLAPDPSPEALALGRRLAEAGTLAALLPVIAKSETEDLLREHPEYSDADKATLRALAEEQIRIGSEQLIAATAKAYAERLSIEDLRALAAFNATPAATHMRAVAPAVIVATMTSVGPLDIKGDTRKAFCAKTGKGCPAP